MFDLGVKLLKIVFAIAFLGFNDCFGMLENKNNFGLLKKTIVEFSAENIVTLQKQLPAIVPSVNNLQNLQKWGDGFDERFSEWNELKTNYFENATSISSLVEAKDDAMSIYEELQDMCIEIEQGSLKGNVFLQGYLGKGIEVMNDIKITLNKYSTVKTEKDAMVMK